MNLEKRAEEIYGLVQPAMIELPSGHPHVTRHELALFWPEGKAYDLRSISLLKNISNGTSMLQFSYLTNAELRTGATALRHQRKDPLRGYEESSARSAVLALRTCRDASNIPYSIIGTPQVKDRLTIYSDGARRMVFSHSELLPHGVTLEERYDLHEGRVLGEIRDRPFRDEQLGADDYAVIDGFLEGFAQWIGTQYFALMGSGRAKG
jgi:hypothetical protein